MAQCNDLADIDAYTGRARHYPTDDEVLALLSIEHIAFLVAVRRLPTELLSAALLLATPDAWY